MIDIDNQTNHTIDTVNLERIADSMNKKDIDLMIVDNDRIREFNKEFRSKDEPTDVLSFPIDDDMPNAPLGSIIISFEYAAHVANTLGHSTEQELQILLIHGILHLMGYDHEVDSGEMRDKEKEWMMHFDLPTSLIARNF